MKLTLKKSTLTLISSQLSATVVNVHEALSAVKLVKAKPEMEKSFSLNDLPLFSTLTASTGGFLSVTKNADEVEFSFNEDVVNTLIGKTFELTNKLFPVVVNSTEIVKTWSKEMDVTMNQLVAKHSVPVTIDEITLWKTSTVKAHACTKGCIIPVTDINIDYVEDGIKRSLDVPAWLVEKIVEADAASNVAYFDLKIINAIRKHYDAKAFPG